MTRYTADDLILCQTADGWSLHNPWATDDDIATGATDGLYLASGAREPSESDYAAALTEMTRRYRWSVTRIWDSSGDWHRTDYPAGFASAEDALAAAHDYALANLADGDYGQDEDYVTVDVHARVEAPDGDYEQESWDIDIEPDHDALAARAAKRDGGDPDCDHEWTSEGEGGLDENPGVWSTGGTSLAFRQHCTRCGLVHEWSVTGSQRNPDQDRETHRYYMPESV